MYRVSIDGKVIECWACGTTYRFRRGARHQCRKCGTWSGPHGGPDTTVETAMMLTLSVLVGLGVLALPLIALWGIVDWLLK